MMVEALGIVVSRKSVYFHWSQWKCVSVRYALHNLTWASQPGFSTELGAIATSERTFIRLDILEGGV